MSSQHPGARPERPINTGPSIGTPARITLYTDPDGRAAACWINGHSVPYNTGEWDDTVAFIHAATAPRQPPTLAEAGVYDLDTLPRLILDRNSGNIVVDRNDGPFLIEFRKDTP